METNYFDKNLNQIEKILSDFIHIFPILMGIYSKIKMNKGYEEKQNLVLFENLIELSINSKKILENLAIKQRLRFEPLFDLKTLWLGKKSEDLLNFRKINEFLSHSNAIWKNSRKRIKII